MTVRTTIISHLTRSMGRGRLGSADYEREVQEFLYSISYRFLGLPPPGNRWLYPDVFEWDEDAYGNHTIPALIAFYFNLTMRYSYETRWHFKQQLSENLSGQYDIYWMMGEGYIWAERRTEGIPPTIPQWIRDESRRGMRLEDEEFSRNGHKGLPDGDFLFMVPHYEPD